MKLEYSVITNEGNGVEHNFSRFQDAKRFSRQHALERGKEQIIDVADSVDNPFGELKDWHYVVSPLGGVTRV